MNEIANAATVASQQSDRWLFIASLILLLTFAWYVYRRQEERITGLINDFQAEQECHEARLEKIMDKYQANNERMAVALDASAKIIQQTLKLIDKP